MIAQRSFAPPATLLPYAGGDPKVVQFSADGVAADVRIEAVDRRRRTSVYAIRLAAAGDDVRGRLVGMLPSGEPVELGAVSVAPRSIGGARLTVPLPRRGYEKLFLEIRSPSVLLRVEAPKPPMLRRFRPLVAATAAVAGVGISLGAGTLVLALPQPPVLHPPAQAFAGREVRVPYGTRGLGRATYVARYEHGLTFASGELAGRDGELALALPPAAANRRVAVEVDVDGPLGSAAGTTAFAVVAPPPPPAIPARIISFAARRDAAAGTDTVLASYLAVADRGTIALQDPRGKIVASAPFAHVGTTRLRVAPAYRDQPLVARIAVERGASRAAASVALAPGTAPAPAPATPNPDVPEAVTPLESARTGTTVGLVAADGRAVAGRPLLLHVMPHASTMRVELQDATGASLVEREVAPGTTAVALPLPDAPGTYFAVLTYERNGGQETVVRSVRALSRAAQTSSR